MPSPFPGMDPYLEGEEWSDVHQALAAQIRKQLAPQLAPRYVVRLAVAIAPDIGNEEEIEIMYPDIEVLRRKRTPNAPDIQLMPGDGAVAVAHPITKAVKVPLPVLKMRLVTVEVRETETNRLVTSIELISPVNKRKPGLSKFREKRERLMRAGVHLLDIDLIRRGKHPAGLPAFEPPHPAAGAHYLVTLTRAKAQHLEIWPIRLQEKLPTVAVPLRAPDADAPLDLAEALTTIYAEAVYDLSLDYSQPPPPPPFDATTQIWIDELLKEYR